MKNETKRPGGHRGSVGDTISKKSNFHDFGLIFHDFFMTLLLLPSHWAPSKAHYSSRMHAPELENIIFRPPETGGMSGINRGNDLGTLEKS